MYTYASVIKHYYHTKYQETLLLVFLETGNIVKAININHL